ncbi:MAG: hypothetical protein NT039_03895 [Candidatus Berkelbacteria bacterium]|nr:hypothetical protein [Candidatus Berkelbacteria bacterium]
MKKAQNKYAVVSKWIGSLKNYGVTESDFDKTKDILTKKFGKEAPARDVIWGLFNQLISRTNDPATLSGIYYEMSLFVNEEGKDSFRQRELSTKMSLINLKQQAGDVLDGVEIVTAGKQSCPECQKMSGKVFTFDEAFNEMPIPNKNCTHRFREDQKPFCRCLYVPIVSMKR